MGVYEVTQTQWESLMGNNPSQFKGPDLPVERVSWEDVQEFVARLSRHSGTGYRLPTEAEWEYAAKGGRRNQDFLFAGSNNLTEVAWYKDNEGARTHAVGQKKPNELGLYDMSGNVWEWCQDGYENGYYGYRPKDNPQGPSQGYYRVVRGGSWCSDPRLAKSTARYRDAFYYVSGNLGFRLVFSPPKSLASLP
jgi:formylglycine-generating enzyme required for sulfatase activity